MTYGNDSTHQIRSSHDATAQTQELVLGRGSNRKLYKHGDTEFGDPGVDPQSINDAVQSDEYGDADQTRW